MLSRRDSPHHGRCRPSPEPPLLPPLAPPFLIWGSLWSLMQEEYSPQFLSEVFQLRAFGPALAPASAVRRVISTRDTHGSRSQSPGPELAERLVKH